MVGKLMIVLPCFALMRPACAPASGLLYTTTQRRLSKTPSERFFMPHSITFHLCTCKTFFPRAKGARALAAALYPLHTRRRSTFYPRIPTFSRHFTYMYPYTQLCAKLLILQIVDRQTHSVFAHSMSHVINYRSALLCFRKTRSRVLRIVTHFSLHPKLQAPQDVCIKYARTVTHGLFVR